MDALDILYASASSADRMVVVIMSAGLVACGRPGWVEPPQEFTGRQIVQDGVHRLHGDLGQLPHDSGMDGIGRMVRKARDDVENRETLTRHPQSLLAQPGRPIHCRHGT